MRKGKQRRRETRKDKIGVYLKMEEVKKRDKAEVGKVRYRSCRSVYRNEREKKEEERRKKKKSKGKSEGGRKEV